MLDPEVHTRLFTKSVIKHFIKIWCFRFLRGMMKAKKYRLGLFHLLTLSICTAFLTIKAGGGSGAFIKKSAIGQLIGASNFVCKQSS